MLTLYINRRLFLAKERWKNLLNLDKRNQLFVEWSLVVLDMAAEVLQLLGNLRFHPHVTAKYRPVLISLNSFPCRESRKKPKRPRERLDRSFIFLESLKNRKIIRTKTNVKSLLHYQWRHVWEPCLDVRDVFRSPSANVVTFSEASTSM